MISFEKTIDEITEFFKGIFLTLQYTILNSKDYLSLDNKLVPTSLNRPFVFLSFNLLLLVFVRPYFGDILSKDSSHLIGTSIQGVLHYKPENLITVVAVGAFIYSAVFILARIGFKKTNYFSQLKQFSFYWIGTLIFLFIMYFFMSILIFQVARHRFIVLLVVILRVIFFCFVFFLMFKAIYQAHFHTNKSIYVKMLFFNLIIFTGILTLGQLISFFDFGIKKGVEFRSEMGDMSFFLNYERAVNHNYYKKIICDSVPSNENPGVKVFVCDSSQLHVYMNTIVVNNSDSLIFISKFDGVSLTISNNETLDEQLLNESFLHFTVESFELDSVSTTRVLKPGDFVKVNYQGLSTHSRIEKFFQADLTPKKCVVGFTYHEGSKQDYKENIVNVFCVRTD